MKTRVFPAFTLVASVSISALVTGCGNSSDGSLFEAGSGSSGSAGAGGTAGSSGSAGSASGSAGEAGSSGASGSAGSAGDAGSSGSSGAAGASGSAGSAGTAGSGGTSTGGTSGAGGTGATGGTAGASGASGSAGTAGVGGTAGAGGTGGAAGASGTSGTSGTAGTAGTSGTGGASGTAGTGGSVTSCADGTSPSAQCDGSTCEKAIFTPITLDTALVIQGNNTGLAAAALPDGTRCSGKADSGARVYAVRPTAAGFLTAHLKRTAYDFQTQQITNYTTYDSVLYASSSCSLADMLACSDNYLSLQNIGALGGGELISFPVVANQTYFLFIDGYAGDDNGNFYLEMDLARGTCADPIALVLDANNPQSGPGYVQVVGSTVGQGDDGRGSCAASNAPDVVYSITRDIWFQNQPAADFAISNDTNFAVSFTRRSSCNDPNSEFSPYCVNNTDFTAGFSQSGYLWVDGGEANGGANQGVYGLDITP
ncbi:MAG: hypothetical protein U0165_20100 [Polyangiaceae bacterium]